MPFTPDQVMKLMSFISDKTGIGETGIGQSNMSVPEYYINLISVYKLARDSKFFVGFDENNCYIQDLGNMTSMGNGSQSDCLYFFDINGKQTVKDVNDVSCCLSKYTWYHRLSHPFDQVLIQLSSSSDTDDSQSNFSKSSSDTDKVARHTQTSNKASPLSATLPSTIDSNYDNFISGGSEDNLDQDNTNVIRRYKARLVAKGFNQREGIDYDETFSPFVKISIVRCLVSLVVNKGWTLYQLDVNNVFLYADLDEDVYMSLPKGNEKLTSTLKENGFKQSKSDYSLFVKSEGELFLALLVYVDDIILTGNNVDEINKFKEFLIKDMGKLKYFLGIEVVDTDTGLYLNQRKYFLEVLAEYGLLARKLASTPIKTNTMVYVIIKRKRKKRSLKKLDPPLTDLTGYQKFLGKLVYQTLTRPDISYTVHSLSQFMQKPLQSHVKLDMRVLRYLKGSPGNGIGFNRNSDLSLKAYVDSDLSKCPSTRRSVTEYRAVASITCEIVWIIKILKDLGVNNVLLAKIFCDNRAAIKIAANPVFHKRTKNLKIDMHLVRDKIATGVIESIWIDS
nr:ribonuclease H-like domain-containing protein [Tanacetum cinerariifolium]